MIKDIITEPFTSGKSGKVTSLAGKTLVSAEILGCGLIWVASVNDRIKTGYTFTAINNNLNIDTAVTGNKNIVVVYTLDS